MVVMNDGFVVMELFIIIECNEIFNEKYEILIFDVVKYYLYF